MRTRWSRLLIALLLFLPLAGGSPGGCGPQRLTILFTTDEHSHLFAVAPELDDFPLAERHGTGALVGGIARRATILEGERAIGRTRGVDVLTFGLGDFSQGTLASAAFLTASPDLIALSKLRYDAVTLGNHEFDLGPSGAAMAIGTAGAQGALPPLVLTNVAFSATNPRDDALAGLFGERGSGKPITRSRLITTGQGLKVGVVGAMGAEAAMVAPAAAPIRFTGTASPSDIPAAIAAIAAQVQPEVDALRAAGADAVIVLGHGGIWRNGGALPGDDELLAAALSGVDLVLSGHTHQRPDRAIWVTDRDGRKVPVLQPAALGAEVGRAELVFRGHGRRPYLDEHPWLTRFIPVDDRLPPTHDPAVRGVLDGVVAALEEGVGGYPAFLPPTLSIIEGAPVVHDPAHPGDLYFRILGHSTFDVPGLRERERSGLNLVTDAMLAVARTVTAEPTDLAIENSGSVRADLRVGRTGGLAFADLYRMVPLGVDPADGTPGYPLVRFHVSAGELRAVMEATLVQSPTLVDFYLSPSGLRVVFDPSRPPYAASDPLGPGWITRLALVDGAGVETRLLYDEAGWHVDPRELHPVVTSWWVASFASSFGVVPKDAAGQPLPLTSAVLRWPGLGAAVKEHQALASYVRATCAANGGVLPSRYDEATPEGAVPQRVVCTGTSCP